MIPPLLRDRVFRRYWSASTISMFGDQISGVALPLAAVLALHAGAAQMGYLTALEWLPSLLFGLPAGAWVDRRGRRRRTMIAADLGRAVLFASIPVAYALHALTLAQLFAVTFGAGTLSIVFNVSDGTLFVSIVAENQYVDGQSLIYGSRALSFVGGPSAGGVLVQAAVRPVRRRRRRAVVPRIGVLPEPDPAGRAGRRRRPGGPCWPGLRFIARSALVRASLVSAATINFFNLMFFALALLYAVRVLHLRAGLVGADARRGGRSAACSARWSPSGPRRGSGRAGRTRPAACCSPRRWCCGRWRTAGGGRSWACCSRRSSVPGSA